MGKHGPLAKPGDERQGRKPPITATLAEHGREDVPDPEDRWLKQTKEDWGSYWGSDIARAVEDDAGIAVVRRLFELRDDLERSRRGYKRRPLVEGSMGQPSMNPLAAHALKLETLILKLEQEHGLTPMSKARLGLTVGQARLTAADINRMADDED